MFRFFSVKEETFAITKLQALWRGYRARNVDPDVIHVRQEMRLRRSEDHIRHLKSQLERYSSHMSS